MRLSCVPYVTALEAYWCTEASAALLLSLLTLFIIIYYHPCRKILNKGPLLYVHLNLAIALLLGYLFFVVGVDTVRGEDVRIIVLPIYHA